MNRFPKLFRFEVDEVHPPRLANDQQRELDQVCGLVPARRSTIRLADLTRLIVDANQRGCVWMEDFADERVELDQDLLDILLAYQQINRAA